MEGRIESNPFSPYADADPQYRHVFPSLFFFPDPEPGRLALAACGYLAVVPEAVLESAVAELPEGLCPTCLEAVRAKEDRQAASAPHECPECATVTVHEGLCALCRIDEHEQWARQNPGSAGPGSDGGNPP